MSGADKEKLDGVVTNLENGSAVGAVRGLEQRRRTAAIPWGEYAFAEGINTRAGGDNSHAEGQNTTANGLAAHAEGIDTLANNDYAHAEGANTQAIGAISHAEGSNTKASGQNSHVEGNNTIANSKSQHVQGEYNIEDTAGSATARGTYAHIVGNGTSNTARSNAHTLDWTGNAWFAGDVKVGGTSAADGEVLATQEWVSENAPGSSVGQNMAGQEVEPTQGTTVTAAEGPRYLMIIGIGRWVNRKRFRGNIASGEYSHAEGRQTTASGACSHAEGIGTQAIGNVCHAEEILQLQG